MKLVTRITLAMTLLATSEGLNCWVCDNAPSNEACMKMGRMQLCHGNQQSCQNEVRRYQHGIHVTKQCKQKQACQNNVAQNREGAGMPTQCNSKASASVCRCCCSFDGCNSPTLGCLRRKGEIRLRDNYFGILRGFDYSCPILRPTRFGTKVCTSKSSKAPLGTECHFRCYRGFQLIGARTSICDIETTTNRARFSKPVPVCRPIFCPRLPPSVENGDVKCTGSNLLQSRCSFSCKRGYVIEGNRNIVCASSRFWSGAPPTCVPQKCEPLQNPSHGNLSCSDESNLRSICLFQCNSGYSLLGNPLSRCSTSAEGVKWSNNAPECQAIKCPVRKVPMNGKSECMGDGGLGSVCSFVCNEGYFLDGEARSSCIDDFDEDHVGKWSPPEPKCRMLQCNMIHEEPRNGTMQCIVDEREGTDCFFTCDDGFILIGFDLSSCRTIDGTHIGVWSHSTPACERIRCSSNVSAPENGQVSCPDGNGLGDLCYFSCDEGLRLTGEEIIVCMDDSNGDAFGVWSSAAPTCDKFIPAVCPLFSPPTNGRITCSDDNLEDSVCAFFCDEDFELRGASYTMCVKLPPEDIEVYTGRWSSRTPTCERTSCGPAPPPPTNAYRVCSDDDNEGSICEYTCSIHLELTQRSTLICIRRGRGYTWNGEPLVCKESPLINALPIIGRAAPIYITTNEEFL